MQRTAAGARRLDVLDLIRGLALIGILQMNLPAFLTFTEPNSALLTTHSPWADWLVWGLLDGFIAAKFYPIFAFLFGYGFALQHASLARAGFAPHRILLRRYGVLLVVGILHGAGLFFGDILTMYACAGLLLVRTGSTDTRALPRQIVAWLIFAVFLEGIYLWAGVSENPDNAAALMRAPARVVFRGHVGYWQFMPARARYYAVLQLNELVSFVPQLMVLFTVGAYAARVGLLRRTTLYRAFWRRALRVGLAIGIPINLLLVASDAAIARGDVRPWLQTLSTALDPLAASLSIAWVALFFFWAQHAHSSTMSRVMTAIRRMGRMALTNYLLQSVLMLLLLSGVGLGAGAWISTAELAVLGLIISLLQLVCSDLWMQRFGTGPFEALWRRATYWDVRV